MEDKMREDCKVRFTQQSKSQATVEQAVAVVKDLAENHYHALDKKVARVDERTLMHSKLIFGGFAISLSMLTGILIAVLQ